MKKNLLLLIMLFYLASCDYTNSESSFDVKFRQALLIDSIYNSNKKRTDSIQLENELINKRK